MEKESRVGGFVFIILLENEEMGCFVHRKAFPANLQVEPLSWNKPSWTNVLQTCEQE